MVIEQRLILISNNCHEKISYPEYVKFFLRENIGYDFGGWSEALLTNNLYKNYDNRELVHSNLKTIYLQIFYGLFIIIALNLFFI